MVEVHQAFTLQYEDAVGVDGGVEAVCYGEEGAVTSSSTSALLRLGLPAARHQ